MQMVHLKRLLEGKDYALPPVEERQFSNKVDETLRNIRKGKVEDKFNWMYPVK